MTTTVKKNIAILASGTGTNAENIIRYFQDADCGLKVALVISNRPDAGVLDCASRRGVPACVLSRADFQNEKTTMEIMKRYSIDIVVLAGFLLLIPSYLIAAYNGKMVNIHPSLLPKFGGKGMYGRYVHEAVVAAGELESGITIHMVSERYDEGRILFQASTAIEPSDTPEIVARKVQRLEHDHYPQVIRETFS